MEQLKAEFFPRLFHFKKPAGTSRGIYTVRRSWFVRLEADGSEGWGECAPLPRLSLDDLPDYEAVLQEMCADVVRKGEVDTERWGRYPSMLFGLETALRHSASRSSSSSICIFTPPLLTVLSARPMTVNVPSA